jgi:hypothetical protein
METMSTTPTPPEALTPERLQEIREITPGHYLYSRIQRELLSHIAALEASKTRWREVGKELENFEHSIMCYGVAPNGGNTGCVCGREKMLALLTAAREGDDPI